VLLAPFCGYFLSHSPQVSRLRNKKKTHNDLPCERSNVGPLVGTASELLSVLFALAALFIGSTALLAVATLAFAVLATLLTAAGRLIALWTTARRLMAALLTFIHITLLSLILVSVVWHFCSPPLLIN
jgi:hypothetical protein